MNHREYQRRDAKNHRQRQDHATDQIAEHGPPESPAPGARPALNATT
jgi:hypothetical protein